MRCNFKSNYICKRKMGATPPSIYALHNPEENMRTYSSITGGNPIG